MSTALGVCFLTSWVYVFVVDLVGVGGLECVETVAFECLGWSGIGGHLHCVGFGLVVSGWLDVLGASMDLLVLVGSGSSGWAVVGVGGVFEWVGWKLALS